MDRMDIRQFWGRVLVASVLVASSMAVLQAEEPRFSVEVSGSGPPVLLIPGLTCDGSVWQPTVEALKDEREVHVISIAGFGGQEPVSGPLLPVVKQQLTHYIRSKQLNKPVLIGHSLGGFLALWIASESPALVGGVVVVDGVPYLPALQQPQATVASMKAAAEQVRRTLSALNAQTFAEQNRLTLRFMVRDPKSAERLAKMTSQSDPATVGTAMAELMTTDLRDQLKAIQVPVLVLVPADSGVPGLDAETVQQRYKNQFASVRRCRIEFVPNVRHFVMIDDPQYFHSALGKFLADPSEYVKSDESP